MQHKKKQPPSVCGLIAIAVAVAALLPHTQAQAQTCTATQIANSDHAATGSVDGALNEPILVSCDAGYEGGGVTFCRSDGTYYPVSCDAYTACTTPPGVTASGHYLEGDLPLFVGDAIATTTLRIQNEIKNGDGTWTGQPLTAFSDSVCPGSKFIAVRHLWQEFYYDMAQRGLTDADLQKFFAAISGQTTSGVYIEEPLTAGGYAINPGKIILWPPTSAGMKRFMAHENMHGWEAQTIDASNHLDFYKTYVEYTNRVYYQIEAAQGPITGTGWALYHDNYGLQNEAEWGSEVFQEWLYDCCGGHGGNWPNIEENHADYEDYFDCLWTGGGDPSSCQATYLPNIDILLPETLPYINPPTEPGFTAAESSAAWKACFQLALGSAETATFESLVDEVAPLLSAGSASHYQPLMGDCNHDGTLDWICKYNGPGPSGVGNGNYLWNSAYEDGTYAFLTTGDSLDTYTEYVVDPYVADPISGYPSIIQPDYRHWQGEFGSCYGARPVSVLAAWGVDPMAEPLATLATCSVSQNLADPSCYSSDLLLWLDADDGDTLLAASGLAGDTDELTAWRDKSVRGNDAIGHFTAKRPTLYTSLMDGQPAVSFSNDILEMRKLDITPELTPDMTSIVVSRRTGSYYSVYNPVQNGGDKRGHDTSGAAQSTWALTTSTLEYAAGQDTINTWINGAATTVNDTQTYAPTYTGVALGQHLYPGTGSAGYYEANHDIAEILIIGRVLTTAEREQIESDLAQKWGIRLDSEPCGSTGCQQLFAEDFEGLTLGPFVSGTESGGDGTDYTRTPPTGWSRDDGTTPTGSPEEFLGFTFLDLNSWIATAGNQSRTSFTKASGTVMVADGDEYDDGTSVEPGLFNAFMTTPSIDLTGVPADTIMIEFDSSFRHWDAQTGLVEISFDSGTNWTTVLTLNSTTASPDLSRANEHVSIPVDNPAGGSMMVRFAYLDAGNDWWWAVDNIEVNGGQ